ncbi:TOM1-like protein 2 [Taenia solium]|eukprot:TsM_000923000 transcript=TsM_000923000 gene=TsM_000923000
MDKRFATRTGNLNDSANNDVGWEGKCGNLCNQCKQRQMGEEEELNETCRMMQQRVGEFLSQVADDAVTLTLIQLNDELNSAFQR